MQTNNFKNKLVAILNKKIEPGRQMNALSHMCIGLGSVIGTEELRLCDYSDADGGSHPYISEQPFIILGANSNKIRKLREQAIENDILFNDFTDTMIIGTYKEQMELTAKTEELNLEYFGIVLYGNWEKVSEMTKKFSLLK